MQLKLPFRLVRGLTVALAIVFAHFAIAWLFNTMKIPMPYLGPVIVSLLGDAQGDVAGDANRSARPQDAPTPVQVVVEPPQHGSQ